MASSEACDFSWLRLTASRRSLVATSSNTRTNSRNRFLGPDRAPKCDADSVDDDDDAADSTNEPGGGDGDGTDEDDTAEAEAEAGADAADETDKDDEDDEDDEDDDDSGVNEEPISIFALRRY